MNYWIGVVILLLALSSCKNKLSWDDDGFQRVWSCFYHGSKWCANPANKE